MNDIERLAFQECNKHCGRMERIIYGKHDKKTIDQASNLQSAYMLLAKALQEKAERENPKPLTFEQLKERVEKPIYIVTGGNSYWIVIDSVQEEYMLSGNTFYWRDDFNDTWFAYNHKPKEATYDR
ncbi:MAG: hypothetical protein ACK5MV_00210 [Aminipila sp.]